MTARLVAARTVPRECRAEQDWVYRPGRFSSLTVPTLVLAGTDTVPALAKTTDAALAALPHARRHDLPGHGHLAHQTDPTQIATLLRTFTS
ncbi:MAG TPA: alpha/beta hydrolase [Acidimicrobiales bacterium]